MRLTLLLLLVPGLVHASNAERLVLQRLQYIGVDYEGAVELDGGIANQAEFDEQRAMVKEARDSYAALKPDGGFLGDFAELEATIAGHGPPSLVKELSTQLAIDVGRELQTARFPLLWPGTESAPAAFAKHCASCHGATGAGDGPAATALTPRPPDFRSAQWSNTRSPLQLFNTITLGVSGTAMAGFESTLDGNTTWALSYWLLTLTEPRPNPPKDGPWVGLSDVSQLSTDALATKVEPSRGWSHEQALAWADSLRRVAPPLRSVSDAMRCLVDGAESARTLALAGRRNEARDAQTAAYYDCVEAIEEGLITTRGAELAALETAVASLSTELAKEPNEPALTKAVAEVRRTAGAFGPSDPAKPEPTTAPTHASPWWMVLVCVVATIGFLAVRPKRRG